jgi:uncharacterized membrane protein
MVTFFKQHPLAILWLVVIAYVLTFFYFTWFKLTHFGYDNLDLAIFNNSLYNLSHFGALDNSIHPPSYWGDHASLFLYLLVPLYTLISSPLLLLWLQVLFLAACVWPLYLISRKKLSVIKTLVICLLWLVNPVLHNMTMFEFSLVPFAMFWLLWSWYWYEKQHLWLWLIFSALALSCREDIALIILFYGIIAWWDKRSWLWRLIPIIVGLSWFAAMQTIIQHYAANGNYKFSIYYLWIFQSSFGNIIQHFFTWGNVELVLGMLFPLFFLPLVRPKFLLLLLAPLASMVLSNSGGSELVLKSHYGGLLLWPLFIALIFWLDGGKLPKKVRELFSETYFIYGLLLLASVYASLTYGSIIPWLRYHPDTGRNQAYNQALQQIPSQAAVATTYSFLSNLSSRHTLQLLPYAYAGKGQFALTDYTLDSSIDYLVIDWQEMIYAQAHYPSRYPHSVNHQSMLTQWHMISSQFNPIWQKGTVMIMQRQSEPKPLALITSSTAQNLSMITTQQSDGIAVHIEGPLPPQELYLEVASDKQLWRWPVAYGLYEPDHTTSTKKIDMLLPISSSGTIKLYSWDKAQLRLNALNSISAEWSDQTLLLEKTF